MAKIDTRMQITHLLDDPLIPPSTLLPPIRKTLDLPSEDVSRLVVELARIYTPDVLGTRFEASTPARPMIPKRMKHLKGLTRALLVPVVDSGYASLVASDDEDEGDDEEHQSTALEHAVQNLAHHLSSETTTPSERDEQLTLLRADDFERSYALKWLTGLISRSEEWTDLGADDEEPTIGILVNSVSSEGFTQSVEQRNREQIIEKASALLAACAGSSASGALTRSFTYHLNFSHHDTMRGMGNLTIQIHLKDDSLPAQDHTAVGLQTWGSAPIFAQMIADHPAKYGPYIEGHLKGPRCPKKTEVAQVENGDVPSRFKVLELGSGTGLLSLFTWRLFEQQLLLSQDHCDSRAFPHCSVLATDFHPSVLSNLNFNLNLNPPSQALLSQYNRSTPSIGTQFLDWNSCVPLEEEEERFDLVYGADVVYEKEHAQLVKNVVEKVLRRPSVVWRNEKGGRSRARYSSGGTFWLIYPLRPTHEAETESIERAFGDVVDSSRTPEKMSVSEDGERNHTGWSLGLLELECLERKKGIGRADEVSYRVLKIGWVGV